MTLFYISVSCFSFLAAVEISSSMGARALLIGLDLRSWLFLFKNLSCLSFPVAISPRWPVVAPGAATATPNSVCEGTGDRGETPWMVGLV